MSVNSERVKLHCNLCLGTRWHSILYSTTRSHTEPLDEGFEYEESTVYNVAECDGCESLTMHTSWRTSGQSGSIEEQWPPKISRRQPKWMFDLFLSEALDNTFKHEFIQEIYSSLKANNRRLAVLGVRALLEQVMLEHIKDQGSFEKNLAEFEASGFISRVQREAIRPVVEAGHASMHRGFKATAQQIDAILDVTENIIESIYVAKLRTANLKVPPRKL
ncbi:MAG: DUF4145 domain-containing protein [Hylemonella sp.]